jgi:hypothetical protein
MPAEAFFKQRQLVKKQTAVIESTLNARRRKRSTGMARASFATERLPS